MAMRASMYPQLGRFLTMDALSTVMPFGSTILSVAKAASGEDVNAGDVGFAAMEIAPLGAVGKLGRELKIVKGIYSEYSFTKSAGKHLSEIVKHGENAGKLARPYMQSPLTIQEIMSISKGVPDATFKGGMNWRVPGMFRGLQGIWKLGINPETKVIYHFNFTY